MTLIPMIDITIESGGKFRGDTVVPNLNKTELLIWRTSSGTVNRNCRNAPHRGLGSDCCKQCMVDPDRNTGNKRTANRVRNMGEQKLALPQKQKFPSICGFNLSGVLNSTATDRALRAASTRTNHGLEVPGSNSVQTKNFENMETYRPQS